MLLPALCTTRTVLFLAILALYFVDRLLPVGVRGFTKSSLSLTVSNYASYFIFRSIPLFLKIISISSSQVFRVLPLGTTLATDLKSVVIDDLCTS